MAREKIFEQTETFTVKQPTDDTQALTFQGFELETTNPEPGQTVSFETVIKANKDNTFYCKVIRDKGTDTEKEIFNVGFLSLTVDQEMPISQSFSVPADAEEVTLTVEGGYEA